MRIDKQSQAKEHNELDKHLFTYHHFPAFGRHYVIYGFGFGIRHSPFAEDELKT